jgi:hypothetical protein
MTKNIKEDGSYHYSSAGDPAYTDRGTGQGFNNAWEELEYRRSNPNSKRVAKNPERTYELLRQMGLPTDRPATPEEYLAAKERYDAGVQSRRNQYEIDQEKRAERDRQNEKEREEWVKNQVELRNILKNAGMDPSKLD